MGYVRAEDFPGTYPPEIIHCQMAPGWKSFTHSKTVEVLLLLTYIPCSTHASICLVNTPYTQRSILFFNTLLPAAISLD